jgi:hypothetical protein
MNLKNDLIRLGSTNPDLRDDLFQVISHIDKSSLREDDVRGISTKIRRLLERSEDLKKEMDLDLPPGHDAILLTDDFQMELDQLHSLFENSSSSQMDKSILSRADKNFKFTLNTGRKVRRSLDGYSQIQRKFGSLLEDISDIRNRVDSLSVS